MSAHYFQSSSSATSHTSHPSCDPALPISCAGGDHNPPGNDLVAAGLLTFPKAARRGPRRRGRNVHTSTLYRWATKGIRNIRLEVLDTPSGLCTSEPAIKRFFSRLTAARNLPRQRPQPPRDEKQHEAIEAELNRRFGI